MISKIMMPWALILLMGFSLGCGGSSTDIPDQNVEPDLNPEQTTPDPATPGTPADPNPVETNPAELDMPQYNNWQDFGLLPMDESLIVEDDLKMPVAYVIGVDEGDVVFGQVELSILATDNIGVNQVALFLNNQLIETLGITSLTYSWDTTQWDDGDYRIGTLLRDDGNNYAMVVVNVSVDNTTDLQAPEIEIVSVTATFDGQTLESFDSSSMNGVGKWNVFGVAHFSLKAIDASEIVSFEVSQRTTYGNIYSEWKVIGKSTGDTLEFDWNTAEAFRFNNLIARATDVHGYQVEFPFNVKANNVVPVSGIVVDGEDERIEHAEAFSMPADWNIEEGLIPPKLEEEYWLSQYWNIEEGVATMDYDSALSNYYGDFTLWAPLGDSKIFIRSGEKSRVIPIHVEPQTGYRSIRLNQDETRLE